MPDLREPGVIRDATPEEQAIFDRSLNDDISPAECNRLLDQLLSSHDRAVGVEVRFSSPFRCTHPA